LNHYEIVYIFNPDEKELGKTLFDKILETTKTIKGKVHRSEEIGSRRLAYPIKDFYRGEYFLVNIECDSSELATITDLFKFNENILRTSVLKKKQAETSKSALMEQTKNSYDKNIRDEGIVKKVSSGAKEVLSKAEEVVEETIEEVKEVAEKVEDVVEEVIEEVVEEAKEIVNAAEETVEEVVEKAEEIAEEAIEEVKEVAEKVEETVEEVVEKAEEIAEEAIEEVKEVAEKVEEVVEEAVEEAKEKAKGVFAKVKNVFKSDKK